MNRRFARFATSGGAVWVVVAVIGLAAFLVSDDFRTTANLSNLSRQLVVLAVASLGQFVVVLSRGVDLSIGASARLAAVAAAIVMESDGSDDRFLLGVLFAIGIPMTIGVVNGLIVTALRVEPFIATLGTGAMISGLALLVASRPTGQSSPAWQDFYGATIGPVPAIVVLAVFVWMVVWILLNHLPWGRHLYAVGGDPNVARLSGIGVGRITVSAYVLAGIMAGIAGLVSIGSTGIGDASTAAGLEFDSLAVVIIGGASLSGGRGRLIGVLGGVVLFGMLGNVFNLLRVNVWYQKLVRGAVILVAAALLVERRLRPDGALNSAPPAALDRAQSASDNDPR